MKIIGITPNVILTATIGSSIFLNESAAPGTTFIIPAQQLQYMAKSVK